MIEQALNRHDFETGNAQLPYFVSAFPNYILQFELPMGYKVPKILKFMGVLEESPVEHVANFQIEYGDLAIYKFLKLKYFPSSLTKNAFTWFITLLPNSIYTWTQLEKVFHEHFFRGDTKVSLIDLKTAKHFNSETIDFLNRFWKLKSWCYTQFSEYELVRMVVAGLDFSIWKKLVNQQVRDMEQLADTVRRIENKIQERNEKNIW